MVSKGVRVNTVALGFIETSAAQGLIERLAKQARTDMESARQELVKSLSSIPIGRPRRPEEVWTSSHFWSQIKPYRLTEVNTSLMKERF